ncbi:KaiC domain protein, AF_0351 family [Natronoarchaeum philippinense]|uniref:KaiC domain protein, AF_0351 family n=1 Tax=Natronoarchaeum philippinense TaxID=558529 RepID=A0A285N9W4_NATPI|nr:KaiC domain protein, AF_0351 family [Natronoarchaeum philippinense]
MTVVSDDPSQQHDADDGDDTEREVEADDDWFDRALREADDDEDLFSGDWSPDGVDQPDDEPGDGTADTPTGDQNATFDQGADDLEAAFADIEGGDTSEFDGSFDDIPDPAADGTDGDADARSGEHGSPSDDASAARDDAADRDESDSGGLFDTDFASALNDAPDMPGSTGGETGPAPGSSSSDPGGFGGGGEFDMATDEFDALEEAGAPGGAGAGGGPGFEEADEDPESDIPRIELGVDGLDAMIQGGVPERALMVAIGSAGTGKTTLGLQFLNRGLRDGERAVYITLEESRRRVIRSATEKGFPFDEYAEAGDLAVVDIDPVEMANSLQSIRSELPRLIDEFGASRLVLDSVSLLEMMYDDRATRRNEIYDFTKSLKRAGVTTLMTSEASQDSSFASRHGIVEYLTDAVFVLQYVRPSDFRETRLAIEIQKIRDANHSRETKPYEITNDGINVYRQANIF